MDKEYRNHCDEYKSQLIKKEKYIIWYKASLIMVGVIVIFILSSIFYLRNDAWLFLSFVGTGSSLILSVIAILITLVDVAGQKSQVFEISESAKKLKKSLDKQKEINQNYQLTLENLINDKLSAKMNGLQNSMDDFADKLKEKLPEDAWEVVENEVKNVQTSISSDVNGLKYINSNFSHYYSPDDVSVTMLTDKNILREDRSNILSATRDLGYGGGSLKIKGSSNLYEVNLKVGLPKAMNYNEVEDVRYSLFNILKKYC